MLGINRFTTLNSFVAIINILILINRSKILNRIIIFSNKLKYSNKEIRVLNYIMKIGLKFSQLTYYNKNKFYLVSILLIFLVLGSIILGFATPSEAAAVGAAGALLLSFMQNKFTKNVLEKGF